MTVAILTRNLSRTSWELHHHYAAKFDNQTSGKLKTGENFRICSDIEHLHGLRFTRYIIFDHTNYSLKDCRELSEMGRYCNRILERSK